MACNSDGCGMVQRLLGFEVSQALANGWFRLACVLALGWRPWRVPRAVAPVDTAAQRPL
jgi:hypothetical protein